MFTRLISLAIQSLLVSDFLLMYYPIKVHLHAQFSANFLVFLVSLTLLRLMDKNFKMRVPSVALENHRT